jgi:hypothetical protein
VRRQGDALLLAVLEHEHLEHVRKRSVLPVCRKAQELFDIRGHPEVDRFGLSGARHVHPSVFAMSLQRL